MVHCASEIMLWGSLINCSGEAAEEAHKVHVKGPFYVSIGPGTNTNHHEGEGGTFMTHAQRKETARLGNGNLRQYCNVT